ncbi:MAG: OmpH family outer membrane protein [Pseudomonadales bacterium]|nr:OmpH family outer membrane protein [Halioglobus sp.]MCP5131668.1 OmpH family outer membrane protein [Pseudomonadales bacterium]
MFKFTFAALVLALPTLGWAEGKIAVVDLQEAILQTNVAQKRLEDIRSQDDFKADKAEFERLKKEMDEMVKKFQKDSAVMSQEQQASARQKLASKQADLEHVVGKVQQTEQAAAQALLQELGPKVQDVLREIISADGIGLLLQRGAVIHADPTYSITAKVTDKLNQLTAK